jgi:hypothetical protein
MHENLRNAFSIKPEDNHDTRPWQHLRSERRSLSFFSLYAKMNFDKHESESDLFLPNSFSFFLHEFKKGFQDYGFDEFPKQMDLFFDTDSCLPVYVITVNLSPNSATKEALSIPLPLAENPSILNCLHSEYVNNYQPEIEAIYKNNTNSSKPVCIKYPVYLDIIYKDSLEEEDNSINFLDVFNQKNTSLQIFGGRYNPSLGTVYSDKCRPVYVKLIP